jgi:replicative DNA helicase
MRRRSMNLDNIQTLPNDVRCEQEILSGIFYNNKILAEIINEVEVEDFYKTAHQIIYAAICRLFADGKDIDITLLVNEIGKANLKKAGGITYITDISIGGLPIKAKEYIKILKDKSYRRKAIKELSRAINCMYDESSNPQDAVGKMSENLANHMKNKSLIFSDSDLMVKTLKEIENRYQKGGEIPGMQTGFTTFDKRTGGLQKGELVIIAGRPSMGKTLTALNIMDGLGKNGYTVYLSELEMTEESLGIRRLSYNANIEAEKLRFGKLSDDDFLKITMMSNELAKRNKVFTDCSSDQGLLQIKAKAKAIKQARGLDVIIIDHLTLMNIPERGTRDLAIGEVTKGLKGLAKELDVNVILLCQLSRAVEQRADKRPMLSDLRESGNIEQDADLVMFMYRDDYYNPESEDKGIIEWIISKQRNGRTGTLKFAYVDRYQKIGDLAYK